MLDCALHGKADRFHQYDLIEPKRQLAVAGKELLECAAHGVIADVTGAAGMD